MKIRENSGRVVAFSEGGWKTAIDVQRRFLERHKLSVHVVLDVPWDETRTESSYDPLFHISRLNSKEWKGKKNNRCQKIKLG